MSRSTLRSALRSSGSSRCVWLPLGVGVAAGWTAAWLLRRGETIRNGGRLRDASRTTGVESASVGTGDPGAHTEEGSWAHWVALLEEAIGDAAEGVAGFRERLFGGAPPDLAVLERVIERVPRAHGCRLRPLGDGIVELVGVCDDDAVAERVAAMVGAVPGVRVVVNRVWTPSSSVRIDPSGASG